jgi:hypothetical protein
MSAPNKIETYLSDLNIQYEAIDPSTYKLIDTGKGLVNVFVVYDDPIVLFRTTVMAIPTQHREELFEQLLRLNAADMLHGAYGLEGVDVVLLDTQEYPSMDITEFEASLDAIGLALTEHYPILSVYRDPKP